MNGGSTFKAAADIYKHVSGVVNIFFLAGLKVLYETGKMEPTSKTHANGNSSSQQGASFFSALGQPMCPARHLYIVVVYLDGV